MNNHSSSCHSRVETYFDIIAILKLVHIDLQLTKYRYVEMNLDRNFIIKLF